MIHNIFDPNCQTRVLLGRVGDKWTVLVICALGKGPMRFGALRRAVGGTTPKVMTTVLRTLERDGFLSRTVVEHTPLSVEYQLTPLGTSLLALVEQVRHWAEQHMADVLTARERCGNELPLDIAALSDD